MPIDGSILLEKFLTLTTRRKELILHHRRAHFAASSLFFCWNKLRLLLMVVVGSVLEATNAGCSSGLGLLNIILGSGLTCSPLISVKTGSDTSPCSPFGRMNIIHLITLVHLPATSHRELPVSLATSPINHRQSWLCVMMTMTVWKGHHRWIDTRCESRMNIV